MACRRIVTGHDEAGAAIILEDGMIEPVTLSAIPGFATHELWNTRGPRMVPHEGPLPQMTSYFPSQEDSIFRVIVFPSTSVGDSGITLDADTIGEAEMRLPGAFAHFDVTDPGMHTTDSVDYGIVLQGEIELELDNGVRCALKAGDVVVQNGTRHAWRNHSGHPATMAFILLGAHRR
jgi:hypothetical protein